ncbi:hypothetical protein Hanom_Chr15g01345121 [Helianthus anomalus]
MIVFIFIAVLVSLGGSRLENPKTYSIHVPPSDIGQHFVNSLNLKREPIFIYVLAVAKLDPNDRRGRGGVQNVYTKKFL